MASNTILATFQPPPCDHGAYPSESTIAPSRPTIGPPRWTNGIPISRRADYHLVPFLFPGLVAHAKSSGEQRKGDRSVIRRAEPHFFSMPRWAPSIAAPTIPRRLGPLGSTTTPPLELYVSCKRRICDRTTTRWLARASSKYAAYDRDAGGRELEAKARPSPLYFSQCHRCNRHQANQQGERRPLASSSRNALRAGPLLLCSVG